MLLRQHLPLKDLRYALMANRRKITKKSAYLQRLMAGQLMLADFFRLEDGVANSVMPKTLSTNCWTTSLDQITGNQSNFIGSQPTAN